MTVSNTLPALALALVRRVRRGVGIPVVGVGGVSTGRHAAEFMLAGASAVQVGTAFMADRDAVHRVVLGLGELALGRGLSRVSELTDGARFP